MNEAFKHQTSMQLEQFQALLDLEGFSEVTTVNRPALESMDDHRHPFEAKALITQGEITIQIDGAQRVYRVGDIFHIFKNEKHSESYGPDGVTYIVGRK